MQRVQPLRQHDLELLSGGSARSLSSLVHCRASQTPSATWMGTGILMYIEINL